MEDFEKMLFEAVSNVVLEKGDVTERINPLTRTYQHISMGITLVFLDIIFLVNHKLLHIFLILGAYFLLKGCGRYRLSSKKMYLSYLLWIMVFFSTVTYDICYLFNSTRIWAHFLTVTYAYGKVEIYVIAVILNLTILSFASIMIKLSKENENEAQVKEYMLKAVLSFISETLILIILEWYGTKGIIAVQWAGELYIYTWLNVKGIFVYIALIPFLLSGKKNMDKGIARLLFVSNSTDNLPNRKKRYLLLESALAVIVVIAVVNSMYDTYIAKKYESTITYITEEDRWKTFNKQETTNTETIMPDAVMAQDGNDLSANQLTFEEAGEKAAKIKEHLISMGVREDILNDLLIADILKLEHTKRVLQSSSVHHIEKTHTNIPIRYEIENGADDSNDIQFTTTVYAFEKFNGDENDLAVGKFEQEKQSRYVYEILMYIEFDSDKELKGLCDSIEIENYLGDAMKIRDIPVNLISDDDVWIFLTDTGSETVYYERNKNLVSKNYSIWNRNIVDIIKGQNYRTYNIQKVYVTNEEYSLNVISIDILTYKKSDYYNEVTKKPDYNVIRDSIGSAGVSFDLLILKGDEYHYDVTGYSYAEDYYDDGYNISNPVNSVLVDRNSYLD